MVSDASNSFQAIPIELLRDYSQARLTRREVEEKLGERVTFGRLLHGLQAASLPLPRIPVDPNSEGFTLVKTMTEEAMARGG